MTGTVADMEAMKELGERIKTERVAQGYSLKTAAKESGIARDTWRKIEAGDSVQDTKRHVAMRLLGLTEKNTEWGTLGSLEDHAASIGGVVDLNLMFSQAVRFTATLGVMVPDIREEAERVSVALSELFAHAYEKWDRVLPEDRADEDDEPIVLNLEGGDGNAENRNPRGAASTSELNEFGAEVEEHEVDRSKQHRDAPER